MKLFRRLTRVACFAGTLFCASASAPASAGTACNKQPVSPQSVLAIGRDMIVNGVATSVIGVQFDATPDDITATFREFWTEAGVRSKNQSGPSGLLLSALDEQCLYVLNIPSQSQGQYTRGLMSVIRLDGSAARREVPDSLLPLPDGSKTLSDIESRDPGQAGRTRLLEIPGDARWNAQQYRNRLAQQGWLNVSRLSDYQSGGAQAQGMAIVMQRGSDSVDASFSNRRGKTVAVVNVTRNR